MQFEQAVRREEEHARTFALRMWQGRSSGDPTGGGFVAVEAPMGFFESSARFSIWDYLGMLRRRWVIFLACLLVLPAIAFFWQTRTAENFQAEASVLVTASAAQEALDSGSTLSLIHI